MQHLIFKVASSRSESRKVEQNPGRTPSHLTPLSHILRTIDTQAHHTATTRHTHPHTQSHGTCRATLTATRVRRPDRGSGQSTARSPRARACHCTSFPLSSRTPSCSMQLIGSHVAAAAPVPKQILFRLHANAFTAFLSFSILNHWPLHGTGTRLHPLHVLIPIRFLFSDVTHAYSRCA